MPADESKDFTGEIEAILRALDTRSMDVAALAAALRPTFRKTTRIKRRGISRSIAQKRVTYDFARLMEGATEVKCSEFADEMIKHL